MLRQSYQQIFRECTTSKYMLGMKTMHRPRGRVIFVDLSTVVELKKD